MQRQRTSRHIQASISGLHQLRMKQDSTVTEIIRYSHSLPEMVMYWITCRCMAAVFTASLELHVGEAIREPHMRWRYSRSQQAAATLLLASHAFATNTQMARQILQTELFLTLAGLAYGCMACIKLRHQQAHWWPSVVT